MLSQREKNPNYLACNNWKYSQYSQKLWSLADVDFNEQFGIESLQVFIQII